MLTQNLENELSLLLDMGNKDSQGLGEFFKVLQPVLEIKVQKNSPPISVI